MKMIIDGLKFNTDKAQKLASGGHSMRAIETLYITRKGNFLLTSTDQRENPEFEDSMKRISPDTAINWLENYRNNPDVLIVGESVNVDKIYKIHFKEYIQEA